ncbi:hypothetical protein EYF80_034126 [Liparis tanakae]|uniref:Uncharacterized protein n=1 Tax=Liparis tanakae TaxID=230148 RepID=A0A4Z2GQW8_9TELE|nr:hypothetical protein EYF80_034126 [Liparis tanakae]
MELSIMDHLTDDYANVEEPSGKKKRSSKSTESVYEDVWIESLEPNRTGATLSVSKGNSERETKMIQLHNNHTNLTKERDQLQTSNTNLTKERDQLQTSNTNLTKERDQLQTSHSQAKRRKDDREREINQLVNMAVFHKEQSEITMDYVNLPDDRSDTRQDGGETAAASVSKGNSERETKMILLQTSNTNLAKERDQLPKELKPCTTATQKSLQMSKVKVKVMKRYHKSGCGEGMRPL